MAESLAPGVRVLPGPLAAREARRPLAAHSPRASDLLLFDRALDQLTLETVRGRTRRRQPAAHG